MAARKKDWKAVKDFYWPNQFGGEFVNEGEEVDLPSGLEPDDAKTALYGKAAFGYTKNEGMITEMVNGRQTRHAVMAEKLVLLPLVRNE